VGWTWADDGDGARVQEDSAVVLNADKLSRIARDHGLRETARGAGCSYGMIQKLVRGTKTSCTPALATRIAEVLGVPFDDLFARWGGSPSTRDVQTAEPKTT
jgi:hypothetical protein